MRAAVLPIALTGGQRTLERSGMVSSTPRKRTKVGLTSGQIALHPRLTQELHGTALSQRSFNLKNKQEVNPGSMLV